MVTLKTKWKNIRDYYRAKLKKVSSGRSGFGADEVTTSTWPLFPCLNYLKDTMQTRLRTTNLTQSARNTYISQTPPIWLFQLFPTPIFSAQFLPISAATPGIPAQKTPTQKLKNSGRGWRNVSPAPPMVCSKYICAYKT